MDTLRILTCGSKHLITLLTLLVLSAWTQGAYADSVPTFVGQTNIDISPFDTSLADSTFIGPGVNLSTFDDDVSCEWDCGHGPTSLTPGSLLKPDITVDLSSGFLSGSVTFGGQQIDCTSSVNCELSETQITALSTIKFPTNDQDFSITVPAVIDGGISGLIFFLEEESRCSICRALRES